MLFYREAGEGPLAVFVHGFPLDHSVWLDQLKGLAHVRRCVALDLRGFGKSDPTVGGALLGAQPSRRSQARLRSMVEGTRYETLVAAITGMRDRKDRSVLLPTIGVPTLGINGEEDPVIAPEVAKAMAAEIPGARTTIVPKAGHLPPIGSPDSVHQALIELFEGRQVVWWREGA